MRHFFSLYFILKFSRSNFSLNIWHQILQIIGTRDETPVDGCTLNNSRVWFWRCERAFVTPFKGYICSLTRERERANVYFCRATRALQLHCYPTIYSWNIPSAARLTANHPQLSNRRLPTFKLHYNFNSRSERELPQIIHLDWIRYNIGMEQCSAHQRVTPRIEKVLYIKLLSHPLLYSIPRMPDYILVTK